MTGVNLITTILSTQVILIIFIEPSQANAIDMCRQFRLIRGFFRDPARSKDMDSPKQDCGDFYVCVAGTMFRMSCPPYTLFDVIRQGCSRSEDVPVDNCFLDTLEDYRPATTPRPLLDTESPLCENEDELACASKECRPREEFCNNVHDCEDMSDEASCGLKDDPNRSPICDEEACQLPECYCSLNASSVPGGLLVKEAPQMIMITFDNAINDKNIAIYNSIFQRSRLNPNGCPIKGTFFVTHEYTNYQFLEFLYNQNHEIGIKSVDQRNDEQYWVNASAEIWRQELETTRLIVSKFGRMPFEAIKGVRAPYLKGGGNAMFIALEDGGFLYDSSISVPLTEIPIYPYTIEYRIPHACYGMNAQCPARSFPTIWEIPFNQFVGFDGTACSMISQCTQTFDSNTVYKMLKKNFDHHFHTNRAPILLSFISAWFTSSNMEGFLRWLNETLNNKHVYFVTTYQLIEWMRYPTPLEELENFEPFACPEMEPTVCGVANGCLLGSGGPNGPGGWMYTCEKCPATYPYLGNPLGVFEESQDFENF